MTRLTIPALAAALALSPAERTAPRTTASQSPPPGTLAFVNVNVIPMDRDRVLTEQTLVITDGRIAALGATAAAPVPQNATVVDGQGRLFIVPGLADMHVHLRYETDLPLLVANGVTLVRNMGGEPFHLDLRRRVEQGTLLGPRIVTAGPQLRGGPGSGATPAEARSLVEAQAAAGYDFIKPYDGLPKDITCSG